MTFLALEVKQRGSSEGEVMLPKGEDLRNAGSGVIERQQQGVIAPSGPCLSIWRCENSVHFRSRQIADQTAARALDGNRQYLCRQIDASRFPKSHQSEKGTDSCQTRIAGLNAVAAVSLDAVKKLQNGWRLQILQSQIGRL